MERTELVKQYKAVFGTDSRYPVKISTFDDPGTQSILVSAEVTFGSNTSFRKHDLAELIENSKYPVRKAKELRDYMIFRMEEKIAEWRAMDG